MTKRRYYRHESGTERKENSRYYNIKRGGEFLNPATLDVAEAEEGECRTRVEDSDNTEEVVA
jgi:hypothetical protein